MIFDKNIEIYKIFKKNIEDGNHFSFSRFNDGELGLIFKNEPVFSTLLRRWGPEIETEGNSLKKIIKSKIDYYVGICPYYLKNRISLIDKIVHQNTKVIYSGVFHNLSKHDFDQLLDLFKSKNTMIVGPEYLSEMNFYKLHVKTPIEFVWNKIDEIEVEILKNIELLDDLIIVYSASIATNILIDRIYKIKGLNITQIDIGSSLDPYCGVHSRTGHKKFMEENGINIKKVITRK